MTTTFRGKPACDCLAAWLPAYEQLLLRRGVIKRNIDIYQLIGGASASAGTHSQGGAADLAQYSDLAIKTARQMGAAAFARPYNWDGRGGMAHQHLVLIGCPHNAPARYQIDLLKRGYNGLASMGRDTSWRPKVWRDWRRGIVFAHKRLQRPANAEYELIVASNNVMALPQNPQIEKTLRATPRASVLLLQEANVPVFKEAIKGLEGWAHGPLHLGKNALTYGAHVVWKDSVWEHISTRFVKQYDAVAGISNTRHIAVTVLQHRDGNFQIAFVSYHAVTAGQDAQRVRMRREGRQAVRETIDGFRKRGFAVIEGEDGNERGNLMPSSTVHTAHGIDHQFAWKSRKIKIRRTGSHTVETRSDHEALVVEYNITLK